MAETATLPFSDAEYERRLEETKATMAERGIDVLLVTDTANINYLSGYDAASYYVPQIVIVVRDRDEPLIAFREQDLICATETCWMSRESLLPYSDEYIDRKEWENHPMAFVAAELKERGLAETTVGVEKDAYYYSAHAHESLCNALTDATITDATLLVNDIRKVKSDQEIEYHREGAKISQRAMEVAVDAIDVGVTESEVVGKVQQVLHEGTENYAGDYAAIPTLMNTGVRSAAPHFTASNDVLEEGTPINMEWAGVVKRYHSPLARSVYLGDPPDRLETAASIVLDGIDAALDAIEPGVTCEEVELAWRDVISGTFVEKESRIGYSTGIGYPPNWVEKSAYLRPGNDTVLQENMVFHMIPGYWPPDEGWGVQISESWRVTSDGVEVLADFPREYIVK